MATYGDRTDGVQVVEVRGNTYHLNVPQLEKILKNDKVNDLPVVVVSIAGAYRGGKSFILNFILKYLKAPLQCKADGSWIGDEITPLQGFSWRGGCERNTTGIVIWPEPITMKLYTGDEVAIILMDTQGTFDSNSTTRDCSTIFALSTLLSSIQIYNISTQIGEDILQHLQFFSAYGSLVQDDTANKAFQALEFLIRDWANAGDYPFGSAGGKQYLEEKLRIKPGQALELKELRHHIRSSFTSLSCFLLPHPGLLVSQPNFNGSNQDLEAIFKLHVKELVSYLFGPGMLKHKKINGQTVKTGELFTYFKAYVATFNSDSIPTPTSIMQATAQAGRLSAFEEARCLYEKNMDCDCGPGKPNLPAHDLKDLHEKYLAGAIKAYNDKKKMGSKEDANVYLGKLKEELINRLPLYQEINIGKIKQVLIEAREAYEDKIGTIRADQLLCVHPLDLKEVHEQALDVAINLFDKNRRYNTNREDKEKAEFIKTFEKQYNHLKLLNEQNNKMAVSDLRLDYWRTMDSIDSTPLSEKEFLEAHKKTLQAALNGFAQKRNNPDTYPVDEYKEKLIQFIENRFEEIRVINKSKNKNALHSGIRAYVDYIASAWDPKAVCLHPGDLEDEHAEGERRALSVLRPDKVLSGKACFDTADPDEDFLCEVLIQRFNEIDDLNTSFNKTAIQAALNVYKTEMEYNCGFSLWWVATLGVGYIVNKSRRNEFHDESRSKALAKFYEHRRASVNTSSDMFLEDLESKILAEKKPYTSYILLDKLMNLTIEYKDV